MPVLRRKDTGKIFVKFQIGGVIYRQSVPEATSIAQGKIVEAQLKKEVFEGKYGMGKDILFSDFVDRHVRPYRRANYKASVEYALTMFCRAFKGKALKDIAPLTIEGWKTKRIGTFTIKGRRPHLATVQNELALLSFIFELACDNDYITRNPMRKVRRFTQAQTICKRDRVFIDNEEERLFRALRRRGGEVYWAPMIARHMGMRKTEVLNLKRDDVDLNGWTVTVATSKNGRPRTLPIVDILKPIFLEIPAARDGYLFSLRTGRSFNGSLSAWGMSCAEAKITDFRFHDLRHVFASSLPPDPYLRAAWLGHVKLETSHIYSHVSLEEMRQAAESAKVLNFERTSRQRNEIAERGDYAKELQQARG